MTRGIVFDIQNYSISNGPGIRTTAFLKGCPLTCLWCHNPESHCACPERMYNADFCIRCGDCADTCPKGAIDESSLRYIKDSCLRCGACASVCPTEAMTMAGTEMSGEELAVSLLRDRAYFEHSGGGGITLSGGEPLMQPEFTSEILHHIRTEGIHTTVDTCGHASREIFDEITAQTDLVLFDLKHMDETEHIKLTGLSNRVIHQNFEAAVRRGTSLRVRFPLIPGYTDSDTNIGVMCTFLKDFGIFDIDVSVYHNYGASKYAHLSRSALQIEPFTDTCKKDRLARISQNGISFTLV